MKKFEDRTWGGLIGQYPILYFVVGGLLIADSFFEFMPHKENEEIWLRLGGGLFILMGIYTYVRRGRRR